MRTTHPPLSISQEITAAQPDMDTADTALLALHLAVTAAMAGLIWFVQVVHYPLFAAVGQGALVPYEHQHQRRTGFVVGPLMGAEALLAVLVLALRPDGLGWALPVLGVALLALIQASTVLLQVPQHQRLAARSDLATVRRLVATNWVRTVGWTLRALVAVAMLVVVVP